MQKYLDKKVIVISGGTKGVGKSIAIECAKQGANVVFSGRDQIEADVVLKDIINSGMTGKFVNTDLHDIKQCKRLFDVAIHSFGRVDGFVNYAGVTPVASLTDCEEYIFDDVFNINIKAAFFCTKQAVLSMQKNGGGTIVLFGSPHSWSGEKDRAAYAVSKGALYTLSEHIAHNYACDKIRCNYVTMGWTPTDGELELRKSQGISKNKLLEIAAHEVPMGRMCSVEDHIPGVIYLLSDYSSMVTGSNLRITGGLYI
ncbi:MAG: SDR family oxidoreductase [Desulfobacteraceae bacterium]|jgi:NAD(P)-dependent dehydrogenase (short-subunit alcohol dehydrogenase family)